MRGPSDELAQIIEGLRRAAVTQEGARALEGGFRLALGMSEAPGFDCSQQRRGLGIVLRGPEVPFGLRQLIQLEVQRAQGKLFPTVGQPKQRLGQREKILSPQFVPANPAVDVRGQFDVDGALVGADYLIAFESPAQRRHANLGLDVPNAPDHLRLEVLQHTQAHHADLQFVQDLLILDLRR